MQIQVLNKRSSLAHAQKEFSDAFASFKSGIYTQIATDSFTEGGNNQASGDINRILKGGW